MKRRLQAAVRGRVQMVGFRFFVVEQAEALGLAGWVRNGDDGRTVELVAEGTAERLRRLEAALWDGPRHARVENVEVAWSDELEGCTGFSVRY